MYNLIATPDAELRHEVVISKSGGGKSEYLKHRLRQQVRAGRPAIIFDAKLDYGFRDELYTLAKIYGRENDFRCINFEDASQSHTYNPLVRGDFDTRSTRITDTIETGGNATAEHFKQQGYQALTAINSAIEAINYTPNFLDLYILMTSAEAMEWLLKQVPKDTEAYTKYNMFLNRWRVYNSQTQTHIINVDKMLNQVGGVANRIFSFCQGSMGAIMNSYSPEVDLLEATNNNQIVFVMLPTLERRESAIAAAKMMLSDCCALISQRYRMPKTMLTEVCELWLDEAGSYLISQFAEALEKMRGAKMGTTLLFQTAANLQTISPEFASRILANTEIMTLLPIGDPDTADEVVRFMGEVLKEFKASSKSTGQSTGNQHLDVKVFHNVSNSSSESEVNSERYDWRIRPEQLMQLQTGQAYIYTKGGAQGYKVQFPLTMLPTEPFKLQKYQSIPRQGLNLFERFNRDFAVVA